MKTPLIPISFSSIYFKNNVRANLNSVMGKCAPDTYRAIFAIKTELEGQGGNLYLSDLFRSYDMQFQAHLDYESKKKKAYSPPPGGSMHEAGRAFDMDLSYIKVPLSTFWGIAKKYGVSPIIDTPESGKNEAWHFDCRGSHGIVYDYYKNRFGTNIPSPYTAMAASAILSTGIHVDFWGNHQKEASVQAGLVRLGYKLGSIDGDIGTKTNTALSQAGITPGPVDGVLNEVEKLLQQKFPGEFSIS